MADNKMHMHLHMVLVEGDASHPYRNLLRGLDEQYEHEEYEGLLHRLQCAKLQSLQEAMLREDLSKTIKRQDDKIGERTAIAVIGWYVAIVAIVALALVLWWKR